MKTHRLFLAACRSDSGSGRVDSLAVFSLTWAGGREAFSRLREKITRCRKSRGLEAAFATSSFFVCPFESVGNHINANRRVNIWQRHEDMVNSSTFENKADGNPFFSCENEFCTGP